MLKTRLVTVLSSLLLLSAVAIAPASAQVPGGSNQGNQGCTQTATGAGAGGVVTGGRQNTGNPADSRAVLVGLVDVLVQDVQALNNIEANLNALNSNGINLQAVCLNDVLNQNDVRLLSDILNHSNVLSNDLNHSLNNNDVLKNFLNDSDIALLNNVQVVAVNVDTGQVFLLRQA